MIKSRRIKILSNVPFFDEELPPFIDNEFLGRERMSGWARLRLALKTYRYDVLFHNCAPSETLRVAALLRVLPWNRCKVACADVIFNLPKGMRDRFVARIKRLILRRVDLFMLIQRDFEGYSEHYGIDPQRVTYVPWKVNSLELIEQMEVSEGDYVFAGGVTLRDWSTFAKAVEGLNIPCVVSIPDDETIRKSGEKITLPDPRSFGAHVRIVRHGADPESWLRLVAHSRFAVLPIAKESLNPSGISTALSIMALGKALVITRGPASTGILDNGRAMIVAPGDPEALRRAIIRVNEDRVVRESLARNGRAYALSCGGESRLYRDFFACIRLHVEGVPADRISLELEQVGPKGGGLR